MVASIVRAARSSRRRRQLDRRGRLLRVAIRGGRPRSSAADLREASEQRVVRIETCATMPGMNRRAFIRYALVAGGAGVSGCSISGPQADKKSATDAAATTRGKPFELEEATVAALQDD